MSCNRQLSWLLIAASLQNEEGSEFSDDCAEGVRDTDGNSGAVLTASKYKGITASAVRVLPRTKHCHLV